MKWNDYCNDITIIEQIIDERHKLILRSNSAWSNGLDLHHLSQYSQSGTIGSRT